MVEVEHSVPDAVNKAAQVLLRAALPVKLPALKEITFSGTEKVAVSPSPGYSTVTLLARFRGLSTSWPRMTAAW